MMVEPASEPPVVDERPGDEAFTQRLLAMQPRIRAFLRHLRAGDDNDLLQETLARAWRSRHRCDPDRPVDGWLLRIAFRVVLDERQRRQRAPAELRDETTVAGPCSARHVEQREQVAHMLAHLPAIESQVLLAFHRDGQTIAAIAEATNLPAGTVKSHLHRARTRLWQRQERTEER